MPVQLTRDGVEHILHHHGIVKIERMPGIQSAFVSSQPKLLPTIDIYRLIVTRLPHPIAPRARRDADAFDR